MLCLYLRKLGDLLIGYYIKISLRTCLHKKCVRIFEHNFVADKAKIRRRAVARQGFLTQSAAKFAEKTCAYACEDRFLIKEQNFLRRNIGGEAVYIIYKL